MAKVEPAVIMERFQMSSAQNFNQQLLNAYQHFTPDTITQMVNMEMKRVQANYHQEEESFVEQMLIDNPIVVERRAAPSKPSTSSNTSFHSEHTNSNSSSSQEESQQHLQQKRADSCRRSRINNKIRKAKMRFRHQFVFNKLSKTTNMLNCIRDVIAQTEAQLLSRGYNQKMLQSLRTTFGVDTIQQQSAEAKRVNN